MRIKEFYWKSKIEIKYVSFKVLIYKIWNIKLDSLGWLLNLVRSTVVKGKPVKTCVNVVSILSKNKVVIGGNNMNLHDLKK